MSSPRLLGGALVCLGIAASLAACNGAESRRSSGGQPAGGDPLPFTITLERPAGGSVSSTDGIIRCGPGQDACSGTFTAAVTLTATPDAANGYHFQQWAGACGGTAATCTLQPGSDAHVIAVFARIVPGNGFAFNVIVEPPRGGTVRSDDGEIECGTAGTRCLAAYPMDATVVLRAEPDAGNGFSTWAGECDLDGPCVLDTRVSGSDKRVWALFAPLGRVFHGHYGSPSVHGPRFFTFLAGAADGRVCTACHGLRYEGMGDAVPSCNGCHERNGWIDWESNCTFCHGTRTPAGVDLATQGHLVAPPDDVAGRLGGTPGRAVGAHQAHVADGSIVRALPCAECHVTPTGLSHVDAVVGVTFAPGRLATRGGATPTWDAAAGTCSATYCHGATLPSGFGGAVGWGGPAIATCTSCHGDPPPSPHPQSPACGGCHTGYGALAPAGQQAVNLDAHVNGVVDLGAMGCTSCHGTPRRPGSPLAAAAPPLGTAGETSTSDPAVGAHLAHLGDGPFARALACTDCHPLPQVMVHSNGRTDLAWSALAQGLLRPGHAVAAAYDPVTHTCATYCHGPTLRGGTLTAPTWTLGATQAACGTCHGVPPPAPHSQSTNCAGCHPDTVDGNGAIVLSSGAHVNGLLEASGGHDPSFATPSVHGPAFFAANATPPASCEECHGHDYATEVDTLSAGRQSCSSCHASAGWRTAGGASNWRTNCSFCHGATTPEAQLGYDVAAEPGLAAPPDSLAQRLLGIEEPSRTGAHQAHLARYACETCHAVPPDLAHAKAMDGATVVLRGAGQRSLPADLGAYAAGTCTTYCHGAKRPLWSGGAPEAACGTCHGLPPPAPHTASAACAGCHPATVNSDGTINLATGAHVDGAVQWEGGHSAGFAAPSVHGPAFFAASASPPVSCKACHGETYGTLVPTSAAGLQSCDTCHANAGWRTAGGASNWQANCSFCHGATTAAAKAGYVFAAAPQRSAPPDALLERLGGGPQPERTGAHQRHLAQFACETCHAVPLDLAHAKAMDGATVALRGAGQRSLPADLGSYARGAGTCATYCHGAAAPVWSGGPAQAACGTCHGLPPPAPHVQSDSCSTCHPDTVNPDGTINQATGAHVDGVPEFSSGHAVGFAAPSAHGPAFFADNASQPVTCKVCHGDDYGTAVETLTAGVQSCNSCHANAGWRTAGGASNWQTNCSFCHGATTPAAKAGYAFASWPQWSAPPQALRQRLDGIARPAQTGAHQLHLAQFTCATCHPVPADLGHAKGLGPATVALSGAGQRSLPANLGTYSGGTCTTYCHGSTMVTTDGTPPARPRWDGGPMACADSCHGQPPDTSLHVGHVIHELLTCDNCHPDQGALHVDGVKDVSFRYDFRGGTWDPGNRTCDVNCHRPEIVTWP